MTSEQPSTSKQSDSNNDNDDKLLFVNVESINCNTDPKQSIPSVVSDPGPSIPSGPSYSTRTDLVTTIVGMSHENDHIDENEIDSTKAKDNQREQAQQGNQNSIDEDEDNEDMQVTFDNVASSSTKRVDTWDTISKSKTLRLQKTRYDLEKDIMASIRGATVREKLANLELTLYVNSTMKY